MRLVRFHADGLDRSGIIEADKVVELSEGDVLGSPAIGSDLNIKPGEKSWPLDAVKLLAPVVPSKIVAIGLNFKAHAAEFDQKIPEEPGFFLKPSTSVIGPGDEIIYPTGISRRVDYEAELAVVIGKECKAVEVEESEAYILGYTCLNDVTARDLQGRDIQWARAKSFDTFAPMGPWIETELDTAQIRIETYLNNVKMQDTLSSDMIFNVSELVGFISQMMTLLPGDVIATGTPSGVGKMKPGDTVEIRVEGIGSLANTVIAG